MFNTCKVIVVLTLSVILFGGDAAAANFRFSSDRNAVLMVGSGKKVARVQSPSMVLKAKGGSEQPVKLRADVRDATPARKWIRGESAYVALAKEVAAPVAARYNIPVGSIVAMSVIESGHGTSYLARKHNAYFGIKADARWAGPKAYRKGSWYRAYPSMAASFEDYGKFLHSNRRYRNVFTHDNPVAFAKAVLRAGYCPDPHYPAQVRTVVARYDLF